MWTLSVKMAAGATDRSVWYWDENTDNKTALYQNNLEFLEAFSNLINPKTDKSPDKQPRNTSESIIVKLSKGCSADLSSVIANEEITRKILCSTQQIKTNQI